VFTEANRILPYDLSLDAFRAIDSYEDFVNETTQLEELFRLRGHIFVSSVKCHPELAGCGIEYSWGKLKLNYRRKNSKEAPEKGKTIQQRVNALIPDALPLERVWKFERKARDYRRMYMELEKQIRNKHFDKNDITFAGLESMVKVMKSHRNIVELCVDFLNNA
jgi:hypothetical protein